MNKKIEFTADRTVEDASGKVIAAYEAGKRYDLPVASADRWIRRGVAFDPKAVPDEEATTGESAEKAKAEKAKGK